MASGSTGLLTWVPHCKLWGQALCCTGEKSPEGLAAAQHSTAQERQGSGLSLGHSGGCCACSGLCPPCVDGSELGCWGP